MDKINELLTRGVANIIPSKEELEKKLRSGKKLNVYLGFDPTATKIHLGHAVTLRKIQQFADLGHNVIFLIGDFTALIGDTSDKDAERPSLSKEEIEENFKTYKNQASKILDFSKIKVRHNSEWLSKLTFENIIKLTQKFSLGDFIGRELIKKRLTEGKRVGLHEALYPIMQGYDSYFMDTDVQVGGTDQTFNMQAGRTLQKNWREKESYVLSTPILEGPDGRKMSKSWSNAIWLEDNPSDMYAKIMAINDDLIIQYYTLATSVSFAEIKELGKEVKKNPMNAKKKLAFEIVRELHGKEEAEKGKENFEKVVQNKELPQDILEISINDNVTASDVITITKFAGSKSEAKRLIEQGGVKIDGKLVKDPDLIVPAGLLQVGKKRFAKIIIK